MRRFMAAGLLALALLTGPAAAQNAPAVVCSLDRPVIQQNGSVTATALTDAPNREMLTYKWTANGGEIHGTGAEVQWRSTGLNKGTYKITGSVEAGDQRLGSCVLEVLVTAAVRAVPSVSSPAGQRYYMEGSLLVLDRPERPGYGLYSYILLASPPDGDEAAARVHALIESYLVQTDYLEGLEGSLKSSQLNVTYIPVQSASEKKIDADSLLFDYNYARAKLLLSRVPGTHLAGPYIVSSLRPLTSELGDKDTYLLEDLSDVPASMMPIWMHQFIAQTSQERFWEGKTLTSIALRLRTAIAIAAQGLPAVQQGVLSWIVLKPGH